MTSRGSNPFLKGCREVPVKARAPVAGQLSLPRPEPLPELFFPMTIHRPFFGVIFVRIYGLSKTGLKGGSFVWECEKKRSMAGPRAICPINSVLSEI